MQTIKERRSNMMHHSAAFFVGAALLLVSPAACFLLLIAYRKISDQPLERDELISLSKQFGVVTLVFFVGLILRILLT
jgi:hypothetical protein